MASRREAANYGVVGCNAILVLIGLERGNKDGVVVVMVVGQDKCITAASSDGEAPSVISVELQDWFGPNLIFFEIVGGRGPRSVLTVVLDLAKDLGLVFVERMHCQVWVR